MDEIEDMNYLIFSVQGTFIPAPYLTCRIEIENSLAPPLRRHDVNVIFKISPRNSKEQVHCLVDLNSVKTD